MLIGLTVLWALLFVAWLLIPDTGTDEAAVLTARAVHLAIVVFGFAFSTVLWGMYRWYAIEARSRKS